MLALPISQWEKRARGQPGGVHSSPLKPPLNNKHLLIQRRRTISVSPISGALDIRLHHPPQSSQAVRPSYNASVKVRLSFRVVIEDHLIVSLSTVFTHCRAILIVPWNINR